MASATFSQAWPGDTSNSYSITGGRLEVTIPGREAVVLVSEP